MPKKLKSILKKTAKAGNALPKPLKKFAKVSGKVLGTPGRSVKALNTLGKAQDEVTRSLLKRKGITKTALGINKLNESERNIMKKGSQKAKKQFLGD